MTKIGKYRLSELIEEQILISNNWSRRSKLINKSTTNETK